MSDEPQYKIPEVFKSYGKTFKTITIGARSAVYMISDFGKNDYYAVYEIRGSFDINKNPQVGYTSWQKKVFKKGYLFEDAKSAIKMHDRIERGKK